MNTSFCANLVRKEKGVYSASPDPLAVFKGPTSKWRGERGRGDEGGGKGKVRERKRKGRGGGNEGRKREERGPAPNILA